jgi:dTDP-4-amino-4,6-dideoxygalactose transaminase
MKCINEIPLFKVTMNPAVDEELLKVLHSGWIGQGSKVAEFETKLWKKFNNPNVLTLSAGTHGLSLALRLAGVKQGDEVISTPLTCTATNMPILMHGGKIVWADVGRDFNIDPDSVKENITDKTKAIMVVHWGGYPCDMEEIHNIAEDHNIKVIEDCAHVWGSTYKDSVIGDCEYSDFAMFSFQAIKHMTAVDGGALCTRNQHDYDKAKLLRWYGIDRESPRKDMRCEEDIVDWGYKYHMNDVCATIGMANMDHADENVRTARENADYYEDMFNDIDGIECTQVGINRRSSYWLFTVLVEDRTSFVHMMGSNGIAVSRVHERNDKHSCFKEFKKDLPGLESIINKMICIPVGYWVSDSDREYIIKAIQGGW